MSKTVTAIKLNPDDNVATLIDDGQKDDSVELVMLKDQKELKTLVLMEDVMFGHKVALVDIKVGESVKKYGKVFGHAHKPIMAGCHVHLHNVKSARTVVDSAQQ